MTGIIVPEIGKSRASDFLNSSFGISGISCAETGPPVVALFLVRPRPGISFQRATAIHARAGNEKIPQVPRIFQLRYKPGWSNRTDRDGSASDRRVMDEQRNHRMFVTLIPSDQEP